MRQRKEKEVPWISAGTDGVEWEDEAECEDAIEDESAWLCEFCNRVFPNDATLMVAASGSDVSCIHCFFNGSHHAAPRFEAGAVAELFAEATDENGTIIGGVLGYLERCLQTHDVSQCPWKDGCYLCDAANAGLDPSSPRDAEDWLSSLGLILPAVPDPQRFHHWRDLGPAERADLLTELASQLTARHRFGLPGDAVFALGTEPNGLPCVVHVASGIAFVVVPDPERPTGAFLLARTPLTRGQAIRLGAEGDGASASDLDHPFTGFELQGLSTMWERTPFRLVTAAEHALAARWPVRGVAYEDVDDMRRPGSLDAFCFHAGKSDGLRSVETHAKHANELGLVDLAGHVDELTAIRSGEIETTGGSYRNTLDELLPFVTLPKHSGEPTPAASRTRRLPIEPLDARDAVGRLIPVRVPPYVGMRIAIDIL